VAEGDARRSAIRRAADGITPQGFEGAAQQAIAAAGQGATEAADGQLQGQHEGALGIARHHGGVALAQQTLEAIAAAAGDPIKKAALPWATQQGPLNAAERSAALLLCHHLLAARLQRLGAPAGAMDA
jgi:hypothetical protein